MKKMTFALACASTLALFAETATAWTNATGFEGTSGDYGAESADSANLWTPPTDDNSAVTAYNNDAPAAGSSLSGQPGDNYLKLDTNGGELIRKFAAEGSHTVPSTGTYIDTMVQFTATEDDNEDGPTLVGDEKLAIWLKATGDDANKTYTLCVKAGGLSADGIKGVVVYDLQGNFSPETWYRLTVKMIDDVYVPNDYYKSAAFEIRIDGNLVTSSTPSIEATWAASLVQAEVLSSEMKAKVDGGELFLSLEQGTPGTASSLTSVGFKGSGAIDELVLTDEDLFPETPIPASIDFTLSWPEGATVVKYTIGTGEEVTLTAEQLAVGSLTIKPVAGTAIVMKVTNANGVEKTLNATASDTTNSLAPAEGTWNKVTPTVTFTGATATIKVGEADYVGETAYEEGAVIKVSGVAASDGYKEAAATVSINGAEAIAFPADGVTIGADTKSIAITVAATQMNTYTVTAAETLNDNVDTVTATPDSFREDAESFVTTLAATFATGYELDYFTVDGERIEGNTVTVTKSITINAVAKQTVVPVTGVTIGNKPTAAMKVGDEVTLTATVAPENATDKTVAWSVTGDAVTVAGGVVTAVKVGTATVTATAGEQSDSVTITVEAAGKVYPEYIGDDPTKQAKYEAWAKANGADTGSAYEEAFLLNVAPTEAQAEADNFKIKSITIDAKGEVTVVAPEKNSKGAAFNGTVEVKGAATVDGKYELDKTSKDARFFKAILK